MFDIYPAIQRDVNRISRPVTSEFKYPYIVIYPAVQSDAIRISRPVTSGFKYPHIVICE
jgi:hypothetical protein